MNKLLPIYILLLLLLSACVGTVEDGTKDDTYAVKTNRVSVSFGGIYSATGTSDDKVEVFFYSAVGGNDIYNYIIYVGGEPAPIVVPSEVLVPDFRGLLRYTVTGLQAGKNYNFRVNVADQINGDLTETEITKDTSTFANPVADFLGISEVSNVQGVAGLDSIHVRWTHAVKDFGSLLGAQPKDPIRYELTAIDADRLNPFDFDNWSLTQDDGRYFKSVQYDDTINEVNFRGLPSATRFYFRVRAVHNDSVDDFNNLALRSEMNTMYYEISTFDDDLSTINFDPDSFLVLNTNGEDMISSMELQWGDVTGVFDHFRVYYSQDPIPLNVATMTAECKSDGVDIGGIFCKKEAYFENGTYVGGLVASSTFNFMIVVCQNADCTNKIVSTTKQGSTLPVLADFNGLLGIGVADSLTTLGSFYLEVQAPTFEEGYFDGYIIGYKSGLEDLSPEKISEAAYNGNLNVEPFNYRMVNEIEVTGINYNSSDTYCFTVYPFVYDNLGAKIEYPNDTWQCRIPEYEAPDDIEFTGFSEGRANGNYVVLTWIPPTNGVYLEYEIYVKKTPGSFTFTEAIMETDAGNFANFSKYIVSSTDLSTTLYLPDGNYKMGVLTNYFTSTGSIKSTHNQDLLGCEVLAGTNLFCDLISP